MNPTPEVFSTLQALRDNKKFVEERFYPGAPSEEIRLRCEARVNRFLDEVIAVLQRGAKKEEFFASARALEDSFDAEDTEEREKADDYVGEAMRSLGLDDWTGFV